MLKGCCLSVTCLREQVIRSCKLNEETADRSPQTEVIAYLTMMDIAVLEKQYNWIKEKQKLQTHVVLFRKGKYIARRGNVRYVINGFLLL